MYPLFCVLSHFNGVFFILHIIYAPLRPSALLRAFLCALRGSLLFFNNSVQSAGRFWLCFLLLLSAGCLRPVCYIFLPLIYPRFMLQYCKPNAGGRCYSPRCILRQCSAWDVQYLPCIAVTPLQAGKSQFQYLCICHLFPPFLYPIGFCGFCWVIYFILYIKYILYTIFTSVLLYAVK